MKKFCGRFTTAAGKSLRGSSRISCELHENDIFVSNGCVLFKMSAYEYDTCIRPVTHCDPGNWTIDKSGRADSDSKSLLGFYNKLKSNLPHMVHMQPLPLAYKNHDKKGPVHLAIYSNDSGDLIYTYNPEYTDSFSIESKIFCDSGDPMGAVCYGDEIIGIVLPVRSKDAVGISAAVKSYLRPQNQELDYNKAERRIFELEDELKTYKDLYETSYRNYLDANDKINNLSAELDAIRSQPVPVVRDDDQKPDPKTAAETIAARWQNIDGISITIKGAATAAPVVWLTGNTKPHANEITGQGGKWSTKKSAYYFRVA